MVRGQFGQGGVMRSCICDRDVMADNDPVEPRHGAATVKTGWGFDQPVVMKGKFG